MRNQILKLIKKFDQIAIFGHKFPDEDCYGSQVALKQAISLRYPNKTVRIIGTGVPKFFDTLIPMDIVSNEFISESLAIILDSNNLDRIEDQRVKTAKAFCKIDHHIDDGLFIEGPSIVDENANSTCDILAELLFSSKYKIDKLISNALYLGIFTDSGRFQFVTNYEATYARVAKLCKSGADPAKLTKILNVVEKETLTIKSYLFNNYCVSTNGVIYAKFSRELLSRLQVKTKDVMATINQIGNVRNHNIWAYFVELDDNKCKVEVRSNGPKIQQIMSKLGGGGHMYAAGATIDKFDESEINIIIGLLDEELKVWKL